MVFAALRTFSMAVNMSTLFSTTNGARRAGRFDLDYCMRRDDDRSLLRLRSYISSKKSSAPADANEGPSTVEYSSVLDDDQFRDLADNAPHQLQGKVEDGTDMAQLDDKLAFVRSLSYQLESFMVSPFLSAANVLPSILHVYGDDLKIGKVYLDHLSGVLTIRSGSFVTYVINKQTPNRQTWLSSPVRFDGSKARGAWTYRCKDAELISLLGQDELLQTAINVSQYLYILQIIGIL